MLDQTGVELSVGDVVRYTDGNHRFQFGEISSIDPVLRGVFGSELARIALFGDVTYDGRRWHTSVYSSLTLLKVACPSRMDWLLTLMPELADTHDRAGADRLMQELRAVG